MSVSVKLILTLVIGYLLGSISTGVIVSRVFGHKDIRSEGSGNSGTTNMLRVMGKKYARYVSAASRFVSKNTGNVYPCWATCACALSMVSRAPSVIFTIKNCTSS